MHAEQYRAYFKTSENLVQTGTNQKGGGVQTVMMRVLKLRVKGEILMNIVGHDHQPPGPNDYAFNTMTWTDSANMTGLPIYIPVKQV